MLQINQNQLLLNLDLAEETRQIAQIRLALYQQQARNFYAQRVKPCFFTVGDWVLHRIPAPQMKLHPNWEGPFEITEVIGNGAYRLREIHEGKPIPRTWNALYQRRYYIQPWSISTGNTILRFWKLFYFKCMHCYSNVQHSQRQTLITLFMHYYSNE